MPVLPLDLVDAHGFNPRQILVRRPQVTAMATARNTLSQVV